MDVESYFPTRKGKLAKDAGDGDLDSSEKSGKDVFKHVRAFEKHGKGIGMKLLEKMGYKGGGLGKNEQGITVPIEAKLRPKNMGLGFHDKNPTLEEESEAKSVPHPVQPLKIHIKEKPWLKKVPIKKVYVTLEDLDLMAEKEGPEGIWVPQVRILIKAKERENDIPIHNVRLIGDEHIQQEDLHKETEKLKAEEVIVNQLDLIHKESKVGTLTLDSLVKSFQDLQHEYADSYKLYNCSFIAFSYALPLLIRVFQGWDPLQNPTRGLEIVSSWKDLLQDQDHHSLFMEVVFPPVKMSGTNTWQAREPGPMLRFLESWEKLLPPVVCDTILDKVVLPKLLAAVDSWDPCRDTIPIHTWIHPWRPWLGHKLETFYPTILSGFESVLHSWHPSDMSAYCMLSPWNTVFDPSSWEKLMLRFIVPELMAIMLEFQVNPANQQLDKFYWVRQWVSTIPIRSMLSVMNIFFAKWHDALYHWLCSNPNFEEVTRWYLGWKGILPPQLLANENIRYMLCLGLEMMNQAAEGLKVIHPRLKESIQLKTRKKAATQAQQHSSANLGKGSGAQIGLKEVIEVHAQHNGLLFKPKAGRMHDGHQLYGFGNISIIIDSLNQKVLARIEEDKWSLVSLEQLLELHNQYGLKRRRV